VSILQPLFDADKPSFYSDVAGVTNANYPQYTKAAEHVYSQIFNIFDHLDLEYYLFAGAMVGYVRNRKIPRWMDDLDLVIFEDQIPFFEKEVIPYLVKAGFNCFKPHGFENAGYHILGLQVTDYRESGVEYSNQFKVRVPWAQVDIFYTSVDKDNHLRNLDGWGLYHRKDIPFDWVKPGKYIKIGDWRLKTFRNYSADISKEYGDVINNVVIADHVRTLMTFEATHFSVIEDAFDQHMQQNVGMLAPSITKETVKGFSPDPKLSYETKAKEPFDSILQGIIQQKAGIVILKQPNHLFWAMDLKRILPKLQIVAFLDTSRGVARAAHLRAFIDKVEIAGGSLTDLYNQHIEYLDVPLKKTWLQQIFG
jgi:hypothetical protein